MLISRQDHDSAAACVHVVDIDGAKLHYHKVATEVYYVLEGEGSIHLDGAEHAIQRGSVVHMPPESCTVRAGACVSSSLAFPI